MAPGVAVAPGDAIVAVDGRPVDPRWGPAEHLADTAGKPVALTIESADGERRTVVVTPLADETPLRYQAWVTGRRAFTRERSDGPPRLPPRARHDEPGLGPAAPRPARRDGPRRR